MVIFPPSTGEPSLVMGRILKSLLIRRAASPKPWSDGSSPLTEQFCSVPRASTVQLMLAWNWIRCARDRFLALELR